MTTSRRVSVASSLLLQAKGSPKPKLRWRRADGEMIRYKGGMGQRCLFFLNSQKNEMRVTPLLFLNVCPTTPSVVSVEGNSLAIPSATRVHIGTYYCIASNGVPPTKSKSIRLRVQCEKDF